jgi:hypothetical protein
MSYVFEEVIVLAAQRFKPDIVLGRICFPIWSLLSVICLLILHGCFTILEFTLNSSSDLDGDENLSL